MAGSRMLSYVRGQANSFIGDGSPNTGIPQRHQEKIRTEEFKMNPNTGKALAEGAKLQRDQAKPLDQNQGDSEDEVFEDESEDVEEELTVDNPLSGEHDRYGTEASNADTSTLDERRAHSQDAVVEIDDDASSAESVSADETVENMYQRNHQQQIDPYHIKVETETPQYPEPEQKAAGAPLSYPSTTPSEPQNGPGYGAWQAREGGRNDELAFANVSQQRVGVARGERSAAGQRPLQMRKVAVAQQSRPQKSLAIYDQQLPDAVNTPQQMRISPEQVAAQQMAYQRVDNVYRVPGNDQIFGQWRPDELSPNDLASMIQTAPQEVVIHHKPDAAPTRHAASKSTKAPKSLPQSSAPTSGNSDLDHDPSSLAKQTYSSLKNEPFDFGPNNPPPQTNPDHLVQQLEAHLGAERKDQDPLLATLTLEEWEDAGEWLLEKALQTTRKMKNIRREKRRLALDLEREIEARHEAVGRKRRATEEAMQGMRASGGKVLRGMTPKGTPRGTPKKGRWEG